MQNKNILIAGGGTGGHLFPALAIGDEIFHRDPNINIHYVGSNFGLESKVFPVKDVWHTLLPVRGYQRGVNFESIGKNILLPIRIIRSLKKLKNLFNDFYPDIIIGTGGYASALPLYLGMKSYKNISIILQEQNSYPGITTRWFAEKAKIVCVGFQSTNNHLNTNTILTGNPVRKGISNGIRSDAKSSFNLDPNKKTIFLFGGSQGSAYLNNMMGKLIKEFLSIDVQILWQTGDLQYHKYKKYNNTNIHVTPFINNMATAYALADLVVCRSGALTLAEITVCGKPSILIPYPHAAGDHQTKNAQALVNAGASRILFEKYLKVNDLFDLIISLINNDNEISKMSKASKRLGQPNATNLIVDQIFSLLS